MRYSSEVARPIMVQWFVGSSLMVDSLSYFLFQPVLQNWCNKGHGMCYRACGMIHIKDPLLLIGKSNPWTVGNSFPFLLIRWAVTIYWMLYNHKLNVLRVSLNKTFPSFLNFINKCRVRCNSVVRAMGHRIDPLWWTIELFLGPASTPRLV